MAQADRPCPLHIADTGMQPAALRIARDESLLAYTGREGQAAQLEFWRLSHPAVLLGCHQWADAETRPDYCAGNGIAVTHRPTGGGAVFADESQLGWSLFIPVTGSTPPDLAKILATARGGVVDSLARLGVTACPAHLNDIEVDQRKIADVFITATDNAVLVQGTILFSVDVDRVLRALRAPKEKLSPDGLAGARQRFITLTDLLGIAPSMTSVKTAVSDGLARAFGFGPVKRVSVSRIPPGTGREPSPRAFAEDAADSAAEAVWPCDDAILRVRLTTRGDPPRIEHLSFSGDVTVFPKTLFTRIRERLHDADWHDWRARLAALFVEEHIRLIGCTPHDIAGVIGRALERIQQQRQFAITTAAANRLIVVGPENMGADEIARRATVMLVPYCAKKVDCEWRRHAGCPECGLCEVGEAYRLARERGMRAVTITSYEHLVRELDRMKRNGVGAFIGMCCAQFYLKRNRAFSNAGIPAVLMDVSGSNCYELQQEEQAYAGTFAAKAELDIPLLRKVAAPAK